MRRVSASQADENDDDDNQISASQADENDDNQMNIEESNIGAFIPPNRLLEGSSSSSSTVAIQYLMMRILMIKMIASTDPLPGLR